MLQNLIKFAEHVTLLCLFKIVWNKVKFFKIERFIFKPQNTTNEQQLGRSLYQRLAMDPGFYVTIIILLVSHTIWVLVWILEIPQLVKIIMVMFMQVFTSESSQCAARGSFVFKMHLLRTEKNRVKIIVANLRWNFLILAIEKASVN